MCLFDILFPFIFHVKINIIALNNLFHFFFYYIRIKLNFSF